MPHLRLAFLLFALPNLVAAAPCDILPYANQCQSSNLWPVPSGWTADDNGDCQPQPPPYVYTTPDSYYYTSTNSANTVAELYSAMVGNGLGRFIPYGSSYSASWNDYGCMSGNIEGERYGTIMYAAFYLQASACNGNVPTLWGSSAYINQYPLCSVGKNIVTVGTTEVQPPDYPMSLPLYKANPWNNRPTYPMWYVCQARSTIYTLKPSDGVCTARWTSSAKTSLQKDPLDPDCNANSCVMNGTCKLR